MTKTVIHPTASGTDKAAPLPDWATSPATGSRLRIVKRRLFDPLRLSGRARALQKGLAGLVMAAGLLAANPPAALAADAPSSLSMEGASLRLVADIPSATGEVRAALFVDLEPGWKTYWLDPGDAGIPPRLDLSASRHIEPAGTAFPLPHRASDPYGTSNVYSQPFAIALTFRQPETGSETGEGSTIDLRLTLGLCRDICIPAAAHLGLDIAAVTLADRQAVAYAFGALPEPSTVAAGIQSARLVENGSGIEVEVLAPTDRRGVEADLFLAGPTGWFYGLPKAPVRDGRRLVFTVPVASRPKSAGTAPPAAVEAVVSIGAHAFRAQHLPVAAGR